MCVCVWKLPESKGSEPRGGPRLATALADTLLCASLSLLSPGLALRCGQPCLGGGRVSCLPQQPLLHAGSHLRQRDGSGLRLDPASALCRRDAALALSSLPWTSARRSPAHASSAAPLCPALVPHKRVPSFSWLPRCHDLLQVR